tara:strand:- start:21 stop:866 length:846 start_codon:yes stop_codon:yes gene_type:complete
MLIPTITTITLITLLIASYSDLKTREVPDWLNYGLIFMALGIRLIFSVNSGWYILLSGVLGFAVCFLIAHLFYYTNQWGGGDAKLLMGMGAMIGITYPFNVESFNILFFFIALLFLGAIYGLIWMFALALQKKWFWLDFKNAVNEYKKFHYGLIIFTVLLIIPVFLSPFLLSLIVFPLGVFYLFIFINTVEKSCFIKKISVNKLTPGDWLAEDVKLNHKIVLKKKTLEEKDLKKLKQLHSNGKLNKVLVKEGIPFIPSFLFAYLFLIFGKNAWNWFYGLLF